MRRLASALLICGAMTVRVDPAMAQTQPDRDRFLVAPFDNPAHETRIYWLAEASAILLADNLNAAGRHAFVREERLNAFQQLQIPVSASLSHATIIRLGQLVGATHVVMGSLALSGTQLTVRAQDVRLDTGRMEREVVESGALDDLFGVFDRLTRRLIGGTTAPGVPAERRPSLPVFESYVKGLLATATPARVSYLQAALKLDPGFDRARLALWAANQESGNAQAALLAAAAVPEASPLYARARFSAALSLIQLKRFDDAFATLKTMADRAPAATLLNNLGVIQLRRPVTPETGKATYYFTAAIKLDPEDADYAFNLGYAYWLDHDAQGAIYWLREAVRRNPADGDAHAVLAAALQTMGSQSEAGRERELATQLSAKAVDAGSRGLERLKPALDVVGRRIGLAMAETGQRDQRELAAFHMDRGRRFFDQGNDLEAAAELRHALYSSPYEADAHLLLGQIYLRTGQTAAAIDAFKISLWSSESSAAHVALARAYLAARDDTRARAEAQRALAVSPDSADARAIVDKLR